MFLTYKDTECLHIGQWLAALPNFQQWPTLSALDLHLFKEVRLEIKMLTLHRFPILHYFAVKRHTQVMETDKLAEICLAFGLALWTRVTIFKVR
jgi:hypothetical protein